MNKINILDPKVANMIAAGEVVERPASVVKELVENSIDAGAQAITVEIKNGGITYIRVSDDGGGIDREDAVTAFQRHATSKIINAEDLDSILTLGFRGEALASIAAVAQVELITKSMNSDEGTLIRLDAGKMIKKESIGCPQGTTIVVKNLFYNIPARMKFLKKDATEAGYVSDVINRMILGHPEISFKYINNGKEAVFTPGNNNLISCVYSIYGKDYVRSMLPVEYDENGIKVSGLVGNADVARANRNFQSFFINGRYIKSKTLTYAVEEAYRNMLMVNKFPTVILHLNINPAMIDVNVHPTKMEVKFSNEKQVYQAVYWAVQNALYAKKHIPEVTLPKKSAFHYIPPASEKMKISEENQQQEINFVKEKVYIPEVKLQVPNFEKVPSSVSSVPNVNHAQNIEPKEEISNKNLEAPRLRDYKIIGQVFSTYIIVQKEDEMFVVDQHAAHERLRFERLLKEYNKKNIYSQSLLIPVVVTLSGPEVQVVKENMDFFKNIGFEVEDFGNNSIVIRQTPISIEEKVLKDLFLEIVGIVQSNKKDTITDMEIHTLYMIACKSAIKANRNMQQEEIEKLIEDILQLENINTCPHGRPIMISMSKYYLEKQFKRIQ
ncbi:DNA mismatch repair endonuclease MutL [Petroclostridium sp. X23]|uniref:DNA mismatch repair endonuclease MutL n=1 Tax=Petroclostridium sp. X23 TaxID=3045146 RepID=UPI0024AC98C9|nr:DNA mismatch repair endonuclease MutL [Petroclostridium sp. X23]WHH59555.1 DNA mismatch repair endonuclease MutL [Petroclostridium sp. X23]